MSFRPPPPASGAPRGARRALPALLALLAALLPGASCSPPQDPPAAGAASRPVQEAPAAPEARHGPAWSAPPAPLEAACADCHPAIAADYARTGMARSLGPVGPAELEGLGPLDDPATGYRYRLEPAEGGPALVETRPGTPHRRALPVAFAVGAGELDRSYAARRGSDWVFAPLEVVRTPAGRRTALAPPHAIRPGLRFEAPLTAECLGCHTDRLPPATWPLGRAPAPGTWEPRGLSCAACHGGAAAHAEWQAADLTGRRPSGPDPLLAHGRFDRVQRVSVCAACHLQGDARILLEARQLAPPPPGGDVLDTRAVFVAREPGEEIGFVSHVERLVLSRCYLESEELSCETCHDPHRPLREPGERSAVRAACTGCHASPSAPHAAGSACPEPPAPDRDCVDCHMRLTPPFDVADVEIHDHFVRRRPPAARVPRELRFAESPAGDWRVFSWPGAEPPAYREDPGLAMMAAYRAGHVERAAERVDEPLGPATAGLPMAHHVRGSLLETLGRLDDAVRAYEQALRLDPDLGPAAVNLGALHARLGRPGEGLALLSALLARHPGYDAALRNRALIRYEQGDGEGFARDLEAAFALVPRAALAASLAAHHARSGRPAEAELWRARAHALDPVEY